MKKYIIFLLVFVFIILSCVKNTSKNNEIHLVINVTGEPKSIDPTVANDFIYPRHAFEGLITKDVNGKNIGGSAKSYTISDDGKTYTFKLRTNAKWSDGKQVTAYDFEYSFKRASDPVSATEYTSFVEYIENAREILMGEMFTNDLKVKATDNYTIEITLENPTAYFLELLTYPVFYPVRKDIIESNPNTWSLNSETYIGNGPFNLIERDFDNKMVFEKSETYWNKENIKPQTLTFILSRDQNLSIAGVKEGSIHFSNNPPEQDLKKLKEEGLAYTMPYFGTFAFAINATNDFLKDKRVKDALSLAIDRNFITETIAMSGQEPAGAWVSYGTLDYDGNDFRENGGNYIDIDSKNYEKNVETAKELLKKAGYANGKNAPILEFQTTTYVPYIQVAEAVQSMWKEHLGIDLIIIPTEWAVYQQIRRDKDYQIMRYSWIGDYNDPLTFFENFVSHSSQNYTGYSNKKFDELITFAKSTPDHKKRMQALHEAEKILITSDDTVLIPIHYSAMAVVATPKLKDVVIGSLGDLRFNYAYLENE